MTDNKTPLDKSFDLTPEVLAEAQAVPAITPKESPAPETVATPETNPEPESVSKGLDKKFDFGSYKNLSRTSVNFAGVTRPFYGQAHFVTSPYTPREDKNTTRTPLSAPTMSYTGLNQASDMIRSLDYDRDAQARSWAENMDRSFGLISPQDAFIRALNRENSDWTQAPTHNGMTLVAATANMAAHQNARLTGSSALSYALGGLGLGAPSMIPLWHSGFYVTFRPASEAAWVNFNEILTSDKRQLGRSISGLAFSNMNAKFVERALQFALEHVVSHTIKFEPQHTTADLLKFLKAPDINLFLWGFLISCYPNGYPITRSCSANIGNCTAEMRDNVNLRILNVTDMQMLSEAQRSHMTLTQPMSVPEKDVLFYQSQLQCLQTREYEIIKTDNMEVRARIKTPTAKEYIDSGNRWFEGIVSMVDSILDKNATDKQREQVYARYSKSSYLRQYQHWVECILLNSNIVDDQDSIENLLNELTTHTDLRQNFYNRIEDYIEDAVLSVIVLPNYTCPVCAKDQAPTEHVEGKNKLKVNCVPLDVAQAFFNLALLRFVEITNR